eukprot:5397508-Pyramimonas_sp.AAC.1
MGGLYVPTDVHRADDPTRNRPVRPPSIPPPSWLVEAEAGDFTRFDCVAYADSRAPYPTCLWGRLVALLLSRGLLDSPVGHNGAACSPLAAGVGLTAAADDAEGPTAGAPGACSADGAPAEALGPRVGPRNALFQPRDEGPGSCAEGAARLVAPPALSSAPDARPKTRSAPQPAVGGGQARTVGRDFPTGREAATPHAFQRAARLGRARQVLG